MSYEIIKTDEFNTWLVKLRDVVARAKLTAKITKMAKDGPFGDIEPVGNGVSEIKYNFGPGYRIYFTQQGERIILLLLGGDKGSQQKDIQKAKKILESLR